MDSAKIRTIVLKGGSALELAHRVISRGSFDVDLSIAKDFRDLADTQKRIFRAVKDRFDAVGYVIFDEDFKVLPPTTPSPDPRPWWGGYALEFKILSREKFQELAGDLAKMRNYAEVVSPRQGRRFRVEISKYEFCEGAQEFDFEGFTIFVYSPEMSAFEKLRAICQQMDGYEVIPGSKKRPRARDFYDIHALVTKKDVDFAAPANQDICRQVFGAKRVELALIAGIEATREFHRTDWPRVKDTVREEAEEFDHYFEFVVSEARKLEPFWVE